MKTAFSRATLLILLFLFLSTNAVAGNIVSGVRWAQTELYDRVVITSSSKPIYRVFTLSEPPRIVIDINNTTWKGKVNNRLFSKHKFIKKVRFGVRNTQDLRIVFEMRENAKLEKNFILSSNSNNSYRIVLDLLKTQNIKEDSLKYAEHTAFTPMEENIFSVLENEKKEQSVFSIIDKPQNQSLQDKKLVSITVNPERILPKRKPQKAMQIVQKVKSPTKDIKIKPANTKRIIVIDPGHGGADPGTIGLTYRTFEKYITLDYARALKAKLEKSGKYEVHLTRTSDIYLSLMARRHKARKHKAELFISLHADAHKDRATRGASVYTLSEQAYDREARNLSIRENKADLISSINLKNERKDIANMLVDLVRRDTKNISAKFASLVTTELAKNIKMLRKAHRFAGFKVLKGVDIPAVLIEMGFLSHHQEEKLLKQKYHREKIINSLSKAIDKHFNQ